MEQAAQKLVALLQEPQPLMAGVLHAFEHAICACTAAFPGCATFTGQLASSSLCLDQQPAAPDGTCRHQPEGTVPDEDAVGEGCFAQAALPHQQPAVPDHARDSGKDGGSQPQGGQRE